jgi:HTH-type transcriptional regulator/antitoxin HigA
MIAIKPIKNKKDYEQALQCIDELWDAKPNTPNGDKLEILVTLVEQYEEKNFKIEAPDPIEAIKFILEQKISIAHL